MFYRGPVPTTAVRRPDEHPGNPGGADRGPTIAHRRRHLHRRSPSCRNWPGRSGSRSCAARWRSAEITGIDAKAALDSPGVVAVLTAADADDLPPAGDRPTTEPLLATDRVRFVGEPVAIVLTEDGYQGEDAAELVSVDYQPLDPVVGMDAALAGASLLFPAAGSNVVRSGGGPAPDDAFAGCDVRGASGPSRTSGWPRSRWRSGRPPHAGRTAGSPCGPARRTPSRPGTRWPGRSAWTQPAVRVITPDVGGGFGAKIGHDRDTIAVAWAARQLGRPVRWVETRSENMLAHGARPGSAADVRIGGTRDGRILAYRLDIVQDCGRLPAVRAVPAVPDPADGERRVRPAYVRVQLPGRWSPTRRRSPPTAAPGGPRRPRPSSGPWTCSPPRSGWTRPRSAAGTWCRRTRSPTPPPGGAIYDTGEYAAALDKVLAGPGYAGLRAEQARRRERGDVVQLGIGVSCYVEITAGDYSGGRDRPGWWCTTTARPPCTPAARRTARGTRPRGRHAGPSRAGHPDGRITVRHGDTDVVPRGVGTYGSRSLQLGGSAVHQAAVERQGAGPRAGRRTCSRPAKPTSSWTSAGAPGRCAATRTGAELGRRSPGRPARTGWWPT